jgi:ankyrin repeat protein
MDNGATPLFVAAQNGHETVVRLLATECQADVNQARDNGATPLLIAARKGYKTIVRVLATECQADVNQADDDGVTPLLIACAAGTRTIAKLLLKANADPRACRRDGDTPLKVAALAGFRNLTAFMLGQVDFSEAELRKIDALLSPEARVVLKLRPCAQCLRPACLGEAPFKKCSGCLCVVYCSPKCTSPLSYCV